MSIKIDRSSFVKQKCKNCIFYINSEDWIAGYCIRNGFWVSESDVCSNYEPRIVVERKKKEITTDDIPVV